MLDAKTKKKVILNWTKNRIDHNKNVILVINGPTGSGKTYAALRYAVDVAEMLGTKFSIKNNVDFNFIELLKKMEYIEGNKVPGTVFLLEEVGAFGSGAGSKQWQSKANQFFSSFGQTSRHQRQIFIMTCPFFTMLQKDSRELAHMQWEMIGINTSNSLSYIKAKTIQVNTTSGKMYMKCLRFHVEDVINKTRKKWILKRLDMDLPPKDMIIEYEKAKTRFTTNLNKRMIVESEPKNKELTPKQEECYDMLLEGKSIKEVGEVMGVSIQQIYLYKKAIHKKGYVLEK